MTRTTRRAAIAATLLALVAGSVSLYVAPAPAAATGSHCPTVKTDTRGGGHPCKPCPPSTR